MFKVGDMIRLDHTPKDQYILFMKYTSPRILYQIVKKHDENYFEIKNPYDKHDPINNWCASGEGICIMDHYFIKEY